MANLFKALKPKADLQRNAFATDRFDTFSTVGGIVNPVFMDEVIPDEYLEVSSYNGIQTSPLFTNNFMRAKQYCDYYFVPYTLMFRRFNQFYATRKDNHMAVYASDGVPSSVPCFNLGTLLTMMQDSLTFAGIKMEDAITSISAHAQSDKIYTEALALFDEVRALTDDSGFYWVLGTLRLLDMLGYGSYYVYFDINHFNIMYEYLENFFNGDSSDILPPSAFDSVEVPAIPERFNSQYPNLWRFGAYQYIWYCYYRNSYWDVGDMSRCFNFDDFSGIGTAGSDYFEVRNGGYGIVDRMESPFMLRCRQWKKDALTGLMQSPQYGAISSVDLSFTLDGVTGSDRGRWAEVNGNFLDDKSMVSVNTESIPNSVGYYQTEQNRALLSHDHSVSFNKSLSFDVYALRKAEMIQKWRETLMRAGNKTPDIFEGVFGKRPRFDDDDLPIFLGSVDSPIQVNPVIATANTAREGDPYVSNLGDVAGRALSSLKSNKIDFRNSGDFGIVMGLMTILPDAEYDALGLDRANTLVTREDYWNPMYQNLGFEAQYVFQFNNVKPQLNQNTVAGFGPRYLHHKVAINKVHGQFMSRGSRYVSGIASPTPSTAEMRWKDTGGSLRYWSLPRVDVDEYIDTLNFVQRLYVSPKIFDNAFVKQLDASQDSDHFYVEMFHNVRKVAPLSVLGLPRW